MYEHPSEIEKKRPRKWVMRISEYNTGVEHPSDYDFESLPIEIKHLVGFEPDEKMDDVLSAAKVLDMVEAIQNGTYNGPPISVRKYEDGYQVIDGHHRLYAHKAAGSLTVEVQMIPDEDIVYIDSR